MLRIALGFALVILLAGGGAGARPSASAAPAADSSTAQPKVVTALYDQKLTYECPECGMDYDRGGLCTMDHSALVPKQVAYICPADDRPVEHAGSCPRC